MSKYDRVRDAYHRAHDDFDFQLCTFYTYQTAYDPSTGQTSISQDQTFAANCEVLQPSQSDLDRERYGVETNVDIVLRLRKDETFISSLDLMGDDVEYQSQVETASGKRFKLIDAIFEQDSAFITTPATESSPPDE